MKQKYLFPLCGLFLLAGMAACENMDDNYKQYLQEYNYSSKIDSVRYYLGFERVALAWDLPKDQKAKQILIEYGVDKQQKQFDHLVDSVIIDGLDEGIGYDFSVYTLDNAGNRSVPFNLSAMPISQTVVDNLVPPTCSYRMLDGTPSVAFSALSTVSMSYCKHSYIRYKIETEDGSEVVREGMVKNEYGDASEALNAVNEYMLPVPELQPGSRYYVDFTAYVYPISNNVVTMDSVPVGAKTRIIVE